MRLGIPGSMMTVRPVWARPACEYATGPAAKAIASPVVGAWSRLGAVRQTAQHFAQAGAAGFCFLPCSC